MSEATPVRTAVPEDEAGIMSLFRMRHEEDGLFGLKEERVLMILQEAWAKDDAIVGVIGEIGKPIGCICLVIGEWWYSGDPEIHEMFSFVHPEHRVGNRYTEALIGFAKSCSDACQMPLSVSLIVNKRTKVKRRFYERLLEPAGILFMHNQHLAKSHAHEGTP